MHVIGHAIGKLRTVDFCFSLEEYINFCWLIFSYKKEPELVYSTNISDWKRYMRVCVRCWCFIVDNWMDKQNQSNLLKNMLQKQVEKDTTDIHGCCLQQHCHHTTWLMSQYCSIPCKSNIDSSTHVQWKVEGWLCY